MQQDEKDPGLLLLLSCSPGMPYGTSACRPAWQQPHSSNCAGTWLAIDTTSALLAPSAAHIHQPHVDINDHSVDRATAVSHLVVRVELGVKHRVKLHWSNQEQFPNEFSRQAGSSQQQRPPTW